VYPLTLTKASRAITDQNNNPQGGDMLVEATKVSATPGWNNPFDSYSNRKRQSRLAN
jgi:hypothetical protein